MDDKTIQRLRALTNFPAIFGFLSRDLSWPIEVDDFTEEVLSFSYSPEELGIDARYSASIIRIRQLRNLVPSQPWGVFYIEFENKRLPVTVLRRILHKLGTTTPNRPGWDVEDLLFICVQGPPNQRGVAFAHFRRSPGSLPELHTFSWDSRESHFYYLRNLNLEKLRWPADEDDHAAWRAQWRAAFTTPHQAIYDDKKLASAMAVQARQMREIIEDLYGVEHRDGGLHRLLERFRKTLLHDLTPGAFADVVAQTITYGLFAAAAQQPAISFDHVVQAIPKTNPFLRDLLQTLINDNGIDLAELGVDRLIEMLHAANVPEISQRFMRQTGGGAEDPVIHFYEQFLGEYDRQQKVERGVFYTPTPVVSYMVRAVDALLKEKFGIADGLASAERAINPANGQEEHRVQVLDPATGTGTFLQYIIETIAQRMNPQAQPGEAWERYVAEDLLPRLYGFELMMAPYTVAHMKLGLTLAQTGYQFTQDSRLRVFLTNALDKPVKMQEVLMTADYLSREANEAAVVKLSRPIMVVIGNPPYSNFGMLNQNDWILELLKDYKKGLEERKTNLNDDYIKFIRFGQWRIEQTGQGILAFITNNSFLDGLTHRQMRRELLRSFDHIYVINLHGNTLRGEDLPEDVTDENVFDIRVGVSINIFLKLPEQLKSHPAMVHSFDQWGQRVDKYGFLSTQDFASTNWIEINADTSGSVLVPTPESKHFQEFAHYWSLPALIDESVSGIQTGRDEFVSAVTEREFGEQIALLQDSRISNTEINNRMDLPIWKGFNLSNLRSKLRDQATAQKLITFWLYRPFDIRPLLFDSTCIKRDRGEVMEYMRKPNLALISVRQLATAGFRHIFVTNLIGDGNTISLNTREYNYYFPLYSYRNAKPLFTNNGTDPSNKDRSPNLSPEFVADIVRCLSLRFVPEGRGDLVNTFGPEDVFHYAYAIFHSPTYRDRYAGFLKIDFPRLPLTSDLLLFNKLVQLGADLVALHLLEDGYAAASWNQEGEESPLAAPDVTFHEGTAGRTVGRFSANNYDNDQGRVYLDSSRKPGISYFDGIEADVWQFQIGGYQVLHKWLYDRRAKSNEPGRTLTDEDVHHYARIVAALRETMRLMAAIDQVIEQHGGWPLRGSQPTDPAADPDLQAQLIAQLKERNDMTADDLTFIDAADSEDLPTELTREMIEVGLTRASGLEEEPDDPDLEDGADISPFDPAKINIETRPMTVGQFMNRIRDFEESDGDEGVNLRPDFQRMGGIWNDEAQSRLIESMMIRIPLPAFYMNEDSEKSDLWVVIDGLQRLTAMRRFMIDKSLRLRRLEFWKEYEGKSFDELPRLLQRRLEETQVVVYLVKKGTPHNVKFNIFKRINTGGVPLSGQEIRHALNLGAATDLLKRLAESKEFKDATANGVSPMRMADRECVLRFLAFMEKDAELRQAPYEMRDHTDYTGRDDLDTFLNDQMKQINIMGQREKSLKDQGQIEKTHEEKFENRFVRAMNVSTAIFADRAFRKPTDTSRRSPVSKALFEVWAVNLDRCTDEQLNLLVGRSETLENKFRELMDDTEFVIAISYSTGDARRVKYRFEKVRQIIKETLSDV